MATWVCPRDSDWDRFPCYCGCDCRVCVCACVRACACVCVLLHPMSGGDW